MSKRGDMYIFRHLPYSDHLAEIQRDLDADDPDLSLPYRNYIPHPLQSQEKCRWCHHHFDTVPVFIPISRTEKGFVVTSCHCSPECARAKQRSDPQLAGIDPKLLEEYCAMLGFPSFPLKGAPSLDGFVLGYGGSWTIDTWREMFTTRIMWVQREREGGEEEDRMEEDGDTSKDEWIILFPTVASTGDPFKDGGRTFARIKGRPTHHALSLSPHITHIGEKILLQSVGDV